MRSNEDAPVRRAVVGSGTPLMAGALAEICIRAGLEVADVHVDPVQAAADILGNLPDFAVLDFADGQPTGLDILRDVRAADQRTRIVLLCAGLDGREPIDAVELGVDGLLLRASPVATVTQCVELVAAGEQWLDPRAMRAAYDQLSQRQSAPAPLLTRRERDVAKLVATGQRNRTIAEALGISEGTVKMHLHNVYAKLGLESRTQLAMDVRLSAMG